MRVRPLPVSALVASAPVWDLSAHAKHLFAVARGCGVNWQNFGRTPQDRGRSRRFKTAIKITKTICECFATCGAVGRSQQRLRSFLTASVRKNRYSGMTNAEAMNSVTERKPRRRFILTKNVDNGEGAA